MADRQDDDDRPKRSWREIDQMRDGSAHRKEPKRAGGPSPRGERSQAYRSYKSQLNKLFDGGGALPDALKQQLEERGVAKDASKKKTLTDAIVTASTPKAVLAALEAYKAEYGFPENEEVMAKLLDLSDQSIVLEAVRTIGLLKTGGRLKRPNALKARLKTLELTNDEPEVREAAKALAALL
ncbi:MAG: hypothetical protein HY903_14280 [Deltaproteobacteria bacterium]|nr:hypothetical protein [Deltaproteobacteria bacterium]